MIWHGRSDALIYPQGSIDYLERVQEPMGGTEPTAEFVRLFMAPGAGHCRAEWARCRNDFSMRLSNGLNWAPGPRRCLPSGAMRRALSRVRDRFARIHSSHNLMETGSDDVADSFSCAPVY